MEIFQKMEEERVEKIQKSLSDYFKAEKACNGGKGSDIDKKLEMMEKVSALQEVKQIIQEVTPKNYKKEQIAFKRATTKYEKLVQKFDSLISKTANPSVPELEREFSSIISGPYKEDEKTTILLSSILNNCWETKESSKSEKENFIEIIKTKDGRKKFGECLNKYRKAGQFSMKDKAYPLICELLIIIIDQIKLQNDMDSAQNIMILSQTFYFENQRPDGTKEKVFLQAGIQSHPFWHEKSFWEKAINSAIDSDNNSQIYENETEEERNIRIVNTVFGKIGTFSHNMLQFGNDKAEVEKLVDAIALQKRLPPQFISSLKVFFNKLLFNLNLIKINLIKIN